MPLGTLRQGWRGWQRQGASSRRKRWIDWKMNQQSWYLEPSSYSLNNLVHTVHNSVVEREMTGPHPRHIYILGCCCLPPFFCLLALPSFMYTQLLTCGISVLNFSFSILLFLQRKHNQYKKTSRHFWLGLWESDDFPSCESWATEF